MHGVFDGIKGRQHILAVYALLNPKVARERKRNDHCGHNCHNGKNNDYFDKRNAFFVNASFQKFLPYYG